MIPIATAAVLIVAETFDATRGNPERSVYHGLSTQSFSRQAVSQKHFKAAKNGLIEHKLLVEHLGYWNKTSMFSDVVTPGSGSGRATRWKPTQKLFDLVNEHGIALRNIGDHFRIELPRHPLELMVIAGLFIVLLGIYAAWLVIEEVLRR